jgi:SpoIID/LytB domain protein
VRHEPAHLAGSRRPASKRDFQGPELFRAQMMSLRSLAIVWLVCLLALAMLGISAILGGSRANAAQGDWVAKGGGFGHGTGMSQYGAYGFARHGRNYRQILGHYYRHTTIGTSGSRTIRVLVGSGSTVGFSGASAACGRNLDKDVTYRAARQGSGVELRRPDAEAVSCGPKLRATGGPIRLVGEGTYRGAIEVVPGSGSGLLAVNAVGLEAYIKGVVPDEMPPSWPAEALRAQAVAARSYALATGYRGPFDHYDDTRSQVYGGIGSETAATNAAVSATRREVVKYRGAVAVTFFFSTSGGRTENVELAMPGSPPKPYLKSVRDPYDDASPLHRWRRVFSDARMQSALGSLVAGDLRRITVLKRGRSPRIVSAKLVGTEGSRVVDGPLIRARLGLPDTWAYFSRG